MDGARRRSVDLNKFSALDTSDASPYSKKAQGSTEIILQQHQQHHQLYPPWARRARDALHLSLMICILGALIYVASHTPPGTGMARAPAGDDRMSVGGPSIPSTNQLFSNMGPDQKKMLAFSAESTRFKGPEDETIHDIIIRVNAAKVKEMGLIEGDIIPPKVSETRSILSDLTLRWPRSADGLVRIPYAFSASYTSDQLSVFTQAFQAFQTRSCLRFYPHTTERSFINYYDGGMCSGSLGYQAGAATSVSLAPGVCTFPGIVIHETMHALGFVHEQSRRDRDTHVSVLYGNVQSGKEYNFNIMPTNDAVGPYDYNSVMHYGKYAYSTNMKPTLLPIPDVTVVIGQREGLSPLDVLKLNNAYCGGNVPAGITVTPPTPVASCNRTLASSQGNLVSPGYPGGYSNLLDCYYNLSVPAGLKVTVTFSVFMLEYGSSQCPYDYVAVYNGPRVTSPQIGKYCGSLQSFTIKSSGSYMLMRFHTDNTQVYPGFMASYSATS